MNEQQIRALVDSILSKSQYDVGRVPYHEHNGIDSPKIISTSINATGTGTNATIAASFVPTKVNIASADFINGVAYDSPNKRFTVLSKGQYLIIGFVFYNNPTTANVSYQSMVFKNGVNVFSAYQVPPTTGVSVAIPAVKVINCSVNDYVELYGQTGSGSTQSVSGPLSYLSIAKV